MKARIRTNLTPRELGHIGKKLQDLVKGQQKLPKPENPAEQELMRRADHLFGVMLESLQKEVSRVLLDKER